MGKPCKHCWSGTVKDPRQMGRDFRADRLFKGITVAAVAHGMGVSRQYVSDLERGLRPWSPRLERSYLSALDSAHRAAWAVV